MKLNMPELYHYLAGAAGLMAGWYLLMQITSDLYIIGAIWTLWYIVMDQALHWIFMKKKMDIINLR